MNQHLLDGHLVQLTAANSEKDTEIWATWSRDSEYARLLDTDPAMPQTLKQTKDGIQKWMESNRPDNFSFAIRTLADKRLVGLIGLWGMRWNQGDTWVGIGIGNRNDWGKGYGTDAMRIILRYAFTELNLHRVSLGVFEYNPRAIRSYEKAGFTLEGRERQCLNRDGKRYDVFNMGILRADWEKLTMDEGRKAE